MFLFNRFIRLGGERIVALVPGPAEHYRAAPSNDDEFDPVAVSRDPGTARRFKSCAVVGNGGGVMSSPRNGAAIDAHEVRRSGRHSRGRCRCLLSGVVATAASDTNVDAHPDSRVAKNKKIHYLLNINVASA